MSSAISGLLNSSSDTGVQAMQLSPCHPGLAGHAAWRLQGIPAFQTCCFPLRLSLSGRSGGPGTLHSIPPMLHKDQPRRDTTHHRVEYRCPIDGWERDGEGHGKRSERGTAELHAALGLPRAAWRKERTRALLPSPNQADMLHQCVAERSRPVPVATHGGRGQLGSPA
jgi:hypothetical protein